ncbi:MAG: KH domain-containing protein [Ruminococcaceae bacterium]|nr:KH domain-containing protein [Oscillospiraceae bacterium]
MEKTIVTTGKTIDLAIEAALQQLGLDRDSVSVQVISQAKAGFLGIGAQPAKVEVTYEAPDPVPEAPRTALSSASRSKPKAKPQPEKKPEPVAEAPKAAPVKEAKKAEPAKAEKKPERKPEPKKEEPKMPKEPKVFAVAEPGSVEEKIETFLKGLLEHMGSQAVPHAWKGEGNTYKVEIVGEDLGYLIGRRGDTLDALQHLANYTINRGVEGHIRISVDAEEYREKREDSLRRYARKKAQQVLKARRRTTLEPMNAYERHVVHSALQDMENVTTHSTGTEPNRRVVIEYVR